MSLGLFLCDKLQHRVSKQMVDIKESLNDFSNTDQIDNDIDTCIADLSKAKADLSQAEELQLFELNTQQEVAEYQRWAVYGAIGLFGFCSILLLLVCQNLKQVFLARYVFF